MAKKQSQSVNPNTGLQGQAKSSAKFVSAEDLGIDVQKLGPVDFNAPYVGATPEEDEPTPTFGDFVLDSEAAISLEEEKALSAEDEHLYEDFAEKLGQNGIYGISTDMMTALAERQSAGEQFINAAGRLSNIPFNIVGSLASMLDFEDYFNSDAEVGNWLTDMMTEITEETNKQLPIYRRNPGEAFDWTDSGWWFENGSGLVNSIGEFVALGAMTGGVGSGLRFMTGLKAMSDGTKAARAFDALASSFLLNQAESLKSATEIYKSTREKAIAKGIDPIAADQMAADAAAYSINLQRANILVNMTSAGRFLKPSTVTRGAINEKVKSGMKKFGTEVLQEAPQEYIEENINLIGEAEGNRLAEALLADKKYEFNIENAWNDVASLKGLEAGLLGAIGAIGQTAGTHGVNSISYKRRDKVDSEGNVVYSTKGNLAYINQNAVESVNTLYQNKLAGKSDVKTFKNTPLVKDGKQLGWIVEDGDKKVTVDKDNEELKAKYGIEQGNKGVLSQITEADIAEATGLSVGDDRLNRIMKIHKQVVANNLTTINDPSLGKQGKELDISEKKAEREWYSLNKETKQKQTKLQAEFDKLNAEMEKTGITTSDVMLNAKEQIKLQNELNLIDVLSDPTVYKSVPKRQALLDKMKTYADNLEGDEKDNYLNRIEELDKATIEELAEFQEDSKNRLLATQVKSHAALGAVDKLEELYRRVQELSPEEAAKQGYGEDYKEKASQALNKIKEYEKTYQKVAGRFGKEIDGALFESTIKVEELQKKKDNLARKKELIEARREFLGLDPIDLQPTKTNEDIKAEIKQLENFIDLYTERKKLSPDSKIDFDKRIEESKEEIKELKKSIYTPIPGRKDKKKAVWGQSSVDMSEYTQISSMLDKVNKDLQKEILLQDQLKTKEGQAKYFYDTSVQNKSRERNRLVYNKLLEMYKDQAKEGDDQAIYFYRDEPVMLVPENDETSDFGVSFVIQGLDGKTIQKVDDKGIKILLENTKSAKELEKYIEDQRKAAQAKANADAISEITEQVAKDNTSIANNLAKVTNEINSTKETINNLLSQGMTNILDLETKFKDGTSRIDSYKFDARDNTITNIKTGKKLFGQSPLRSRLEKQFIDQFTDARETVATNNAAVDKLEETLMDYEGVYDKLSAEQEAMEKFMEVFREREKMLKGADANFQQLYEDAENALKGSFGTSVENLQNQAASLEKQKSDLLARVTDLQKILDAAKVSNVDALTQNSLEVAMIKQKRQLEQVQKQFDRMSSELDEYVNNTELKDMLEKMAEFAMKAQAEARKLAEKTAKDYGYQNAPTPGSNPEPVEADEKDIELGNSARKISAYTTAGNDLMDPSEESKRWYRALNKLGPNSVRKYKLEFITSEEATRRIPEDPAYATVFSAENRDAEIYEYKDGKPVLDEDGEKIKRETPYVGYRAVLIYKDGSLVKATSDGTISSKEGSLALSTYIHNPDGKVLVFKDEDGNLQSKLSVPHIIRENPEFRYDGKPYALSTIRGWLSSNEEVNAPGGPYENGTDLQNKILQDLYDDLHQFRNRIGSKIANGERAIANIESLTGGHPIRAPRNFEGNKIENKPSKVFGSAKSLKSMTVTPRGEVMVEDFKGRRLDLTPRTLNEDEVTIVQALLDVTLGGIEETGNVRKVPVKGTKGYPMFPLKSDSVYSVIEQYIYWGKAKEGKNADYQIYYDKDTQRLHFGADESIPFSEIMTSDALKTFLSTKRLNFNKTINSKIKKQGKEGSPYNMVIFKDGEFITKTYKGEGNLSGYENFIYQNYSTDLVESTPERPNFAQRAIKFTNTLTELTDVDEDIEDDVEETEETADTPAEASSEYTKKGTKEESEDAEDFGDLDLENVDEDSGEKLDADGNVIDSTDEDGFYSGLTGEGDSGTTNEVVEPAEKKPAPEKGKGKTKADLDSENTQFDVFLQRLKREGITPNYADLDSFRKVVSEEDLSFFFKMISNTQLVDDFTEEVEQGYYKADITMFAKGSTALKIGTFFKLTPIQTVKLHNFISKNARKFEAKGLSLDPAVYEADLRSTPGTVDDFINILENYLNC
jgi:hypothetical protein